MTQKTPLIMAVDDEWLNLELLEGVLSSIGYRSLLVNSSVQALAKAREHQPDLILVDIRMPKMSGYDVCQHLRQDPVTALTPILLISGLSASAEEQTRANDVGANAILDRTIGVEGLIAQIKTFLPDD